MTKPAPLCTWGFPTASCGTRAIALVCVPAASPFQEAAFKYETVCAKHVVSAGGTLSRVLEPCQYVTGPSYGDRQDVLCGKFAAALVEHQGSAPGGRPMCRAHAEITRRNYAGDPLPPIVRWAVERHPAPLDESAPMPGLLPERCRCGGTWSQMDRPAERDEIAETARGGLQSCWKLGSAAYLTCGTCANVTEFEHGPKGWREAPITEIAMHGGAGIPATCERLHRTDYLDPSKGNRCTNRPEVLTSRLPGSGADPREKWMCLRCAETLSHQRKIIATRPESPEGIQHEPAIAPHAYTAGTITDPKAMYNSGPTEWSAPEAVVVPANGRPVRVRLSSSIGIHDDSTSKEVRLVPERCTHEAPTDASSQTRRYWIEENICNGCGQWVDDEPMIAPGDPVQVFEAAPVRAPIDVQTLSPEQIDALMAAILDRKATEHRAKVEPLALLARQAAEWFVRALHDLGAAGGQYELRIEASSTGDVELDADDLQALQIELIPSDKAQ